MNDVDINIYNLGCQEKPDSIFFKDQISTRIVSYVTQNILDDLKFVPRALSRDMS